MPWTATVLSASPNATPDDSIAVNVQFTDGSRTFVKSYNMNAAAFPDQVAVQKYIAQEVANLESVYVLMDQLNAQPINIVPNTVTNFQARAALVAAGLFETADAAVHASGNQLAIQAWEYANNFYRNSPLIETMAAALGLDSAQVDDLFRQAATVNI